MEEDLGIDRRDVVDRGGRAGPPSKAALNLEGAQDEQRPRRSRGRGGGDCASGALRHAERAGRVAASEIDDAHAPPPTTSPATVCAARCAWPRRRARGRPRCAPSGAALPVNSSRASPRRSRSSRKAAAVARSAVDGRVGVHAAHQLAATSCAVVRQRYRRDVDRPPRVPHAGWPERLRGARDSACLFSCTRRRAGLRSTAGVPTAAGVALLGIRQGRWSACSSRFAAESGSQVCRDAAAADDGSASPVG